MSHQIKRAPLNPRFLHYLQEKKYGSWRIQSSGGHWLGLIPAPLDLSYLKGKKIFSSYETYPSSYDLRTLGKATSVKNQGSCNSCWAFATYGSLESYLLPGETWDFSEQNLIDNHGFDPGPCDGGSVWMSSAYLARWSGPILEADDPYIYSAAEGLTEQKHVQDIIFFPGRANYLDNDNLKQVLITYGEVVVSLYYDDAYYDSANNSYYCDSPSDTNHVVTVVGWDDDYDKSRFYIPPPGNGAFILKNSYGTGWGDSGYFYVSYYDQTFKPGAAFMADATTNYAGIYQYDDLGWLNNRGEGSDTEWGANIFNANSNHSIKAVSFYGVNVNCSYEVYIYTDVTDGAPRSGNLALSQTGTLPSPGYHTIALINSVPVSLNQKFSVVVKFQTPGYLYPAPVEEKFPGYSSGAISLPGESFMSPDGTTWTDVSDAPFYINICIKAFTAPTEETLNSPLLLAPVDGAATQPLNPTLQWQDTNSTPQEQGHKIRIKPSGGSYTYYDLAQDSTTYELSNLSPSTKYYWDVRAVGNGNSILDSQWAHSDADWSLTTSPPATLAAPALTVPSNGATNQPPTLTVQWQDTNTHPQEQGYRIRIKSSGGSYVYYTTAQNAISSQISGLVYGTTYDWGVQAVGNGTDVLDSAWSDSGIDWHFTTIGPTSLNAPALASPPEAATKQPLNTILQWQDTNINPQEQGYKIRIKNAGGNYSFYTVSQNTTSFQPPPLSLNTIYYWSVQAIGNGNNTADSAWANSGLDRSFKTAARVTLFAPTPAAPSNGVSGQPPAVELQWSDTNSDPQEVKYKIRFKAAGGAYVFINVSQDTTSYLKGGLAPNKTYYWNVQAVGNGANILNSSWANSGVDWTFRTAAPVILNAPTLIAPPGGATDQPLTIMLQWLDTNGSPQEQHYRIRIKPAGGGYAFFNSAQDATSYIKSALGRNKTYSWNVRAKGDGSGTKDSPWAGAGVDWKFTTIK